MNFSLTETYSKTGYLRSKDHTPLFYRHYAVVEPKASVFLVHGFGEHSGRYFHVIESLRQENFEVWCIDFRGHGHSEGKRGDVADFCRYEEDVLAGLDHISNHRTNADQKIFLLAHSMGALVSLRAINKAKPEVNGIVLSCPLFALKMPMPVWKRWASFVLAKLTPRIKVRSGIKGLDLSSDHEVVSAYDNDPLVLKNLSVRAFREILKGYQESSSLAQSMSLSFLMQLGGSDPVVDSHISQRWFSQVNHGKVDATMKVYPGFLHEIYNETNRHEAIKDFLQWLNARV